MKIRLILVMTSALLVGFGPSPARAGGGLAGSGDPFTAFFDENGNGFYDPRDGDRAPNPAGAGRSGNDPPHLPLAVPRHHGRRPDL